MEMEYKCSFCKKDTISQSQFIYYNKLLAVPVYECVCNNCFLSSEVPSTQFEVLPSKFLFDEEIDEVCMN